MSISAPFPVHAPLLATVALALACAPAQGPSGPPAEPDHERDREHPALARAAGAGRAPVLSVSGSGEMSGEFPPGTITFRQSGSVQRLADGTTRGRVQVSGTIPYPDPSTGAPIGRFSVLGEALCLAVERRADALHVALVFRARRASPATAFAGSEYGYLYLVETAAGQVAWGGPTGGDAVPGVTLPCAVPATLPADVPPLRPVRGRFQVRADG